MSKIDNIRKVAKILDNIEDDSRTKILSELEEKDPKLAKEIQKNMFVFDDLCNLDDNSFKILITHVPLAKWTLVLKLVSDDFKKKLFQNLSSRNAQEIQEVFNNLGLVPKTKVERIQQEIIEIALQLNSEGKITISTNKEELVY